jgi:Bacterial SH3 domain
MLKQCFAKRRIICALFLIALLSLSTVGTGLQAVRAQEALSAIGETATVGPWELTLAEVQTGDGASGLASGAGNPESPSEDGTQYVAARFTMHNISTQPLIVSPDDFAAVGDAGIVRRSAAVFLPDPGLSGSVAAGDAFDGWVLSSVESDTSSVVIFYDSATITGTWADHAFAATDGASWEPKTDHVNEPNNAGSDPGSPAGPDEAVSTVEWTVEIVDVVTGSDVNDISPETTQRLGNNYLAGGTYAICLETWVAVQIQVTNNAADGLTRTLPQTSFLLANADGTEVPDVRMLSAPLPEVGAEYAAGATRAGWISFELPSLCQGDEVNLQYFDNLLRFQPFTNSADPRYLTWGGATAAPEPTEASVDPDNIYANGTTLVVAPDSTVNLRTDPSTSADVITELATGTEVEVTGDPQSADGYIWYPVRVSETGDEGWAVADFLAEP